MTKTKLITVDDFKVHLKSIYGEPFKQVLKKNEEQFDRAFRSIEDLIKFLRVLSIDQRDIFFESKPRYLKKLLKAKDESFLANFLMDFTYELTLKRLKEKWVSIFKTEENVEEFLMKMIESNPLLIHHVNPKIENYQALVEKAKAEIVKSSAKDNKKALENIAALTTDNNVRFTEIRSPQFTDPINVDLSKHPGLNPTVNCLTIKQLAIGDLHANVMRLLNTLVWHGYISCSNSTYERLFYIVKKHNDLMNLFKSKCFEKIDKKYKEKHGINRNYKSFHDISAEDVENLGSTLLQQEDALIREILDNIQEFDSVLELVEVNKTDAELLVNGDEASDRGPQDRFMFKLLKKLKAGNIRFSTTLSNHFAELMCNYSADIGAFEKYGQPITLNQRRDGDGRVLARNVGQCTLPVLQQHNSLTNFRILLYLINIFQRPNDLETAADIDSYIRSLKLIDYTLDPSEKNIVLSTHAPICKRNIKHFAQVLEVIEEEQMQSPQGLATCINKINAVFEKDKSSLHMDYHPTDNTKDLYCHIFAANLTADPNNDEAILAEINQLKAANQAECKSFVFFDKNNKIYFKTLADPAFPLLFQSKNDPVFLERFKSKMLRGKQSRRIDTVDEWALVKDIETNLFPDLLELRKSRVYGFLTWNRDLSELKEEIEHSENKIGTTLISYIFGHTLVPHDLPHIYGTDSNLGKDFLSTKGEYQSAYIPRSDIKLVSQLKKEIEELCHKFELKIKKNAILPDIDKKLTQYFKNSKEITEELFNTPVPNQAKLTAFKHSFMESITNIKNELSEVIKEQLIIASRPQNVAVPTTNHLLKILQQTAIAIIAFAKTIISIVKNFIKSIFRISNTGKSKFFSSETIKSQFRVIEHELNSMQAELITLVDEGLTLVTPLSRPSS